MRALKKEEDETSDMYGPYGGVAQLGEHLLCKQGVRGSIPLISTTFGRRETVMRRKTKDHNNGL